MLRGGRAHVGAIGLGVPRPSLLDASQTSATSSVLTILGHKDDELAKPLAESLSRRLGRLTVVVAGVHFGGLQEAGIQNILEVCRRLADGIVAEMGPAGRDGGGGR